MARRKREIPTYFSIEVGVVRGIAESMDDYQWSKWSKKALDDLSIGCVRKDTDPRVREVFEKSKSEMDAEYQRKKEWYENKKASREECLSTATGNDQVPADAATREGSLNMTNGRNAVALESGTSANLYGDASHREAEDESATVSNPFALDMPSPDKVNAKTRDSLGRGRYQPPSLGPEDGNLYDQVPDKVSTKPTGGHIIRSSSRSPVGDVLSLAYSGEFGNVRLTQEQYAELGIKFGNQQKLNRAIDSLSCKLENDELKPVPRSHYAVLVKWANYRDDMDEKEELRASSAPHYETVSEHNARVVAEGKKWIDEHFPKKDKKNG